MRTIIDAKSVERGGAGLSDRLLDAIVESAPIAMILCGECGDVKWANREVEALFGYSRAELLGQLVEVLVPSTSRHVHASLRRAFFSHPNARPMGVGKELFGRRKDGSQVPIEIGLTPLDTDQGSCVLTVVVDITHRRKLEADIRRANEELEQRVHERTLELELANREKELLLADLQAQRADLERLSREDPLTKLANRRDFDRRLASEIQRAQRQGMPLAVAMLDLDRFKSVNDRFGHAVGDAVLCETADLIRRLCRAIDVISRYGGEEFAIAMPGADCSSGAILCERIRQAFQEHDWTALHADLAVSVSAGVSCWLQGMDARALLAQADANLYEAKHQGRNRVVSASLLALPMAPQAT